ncbi:1-aminocyclopropane-1-carboxylate deaminase [Pedobacter sp. PACM 27299]|uniref:1-aminocyclopropane-1-carboxylate deaminase/D-cysteine desulfhydrase n=1 Tax=Pedobacter sp. PACM 27299 TaxID=1727164 RepID=UPI000705E7F6|nr:pyridoxal-phosphate dependent enzyme [Pedobacter sp. PACM 27299]ALL07855.1 1-aminocyclopropane-1-carboxylate deaminase [Pedobacter sp. PACM 27299]
MFTDIHSPVQQLKHPILQQLWIKRDDLIDPYISGNKWRKLKYLLSKAKKENKHHLVTFGGAYSNHLLATAAAASRAGLKSTAFVRGETVKNEMLMLCQLFGMTLLFVDRTSYKNKTSLFEQHFGDDPNAFFIDEGGAGMEALTGCAEIIAELPEATDHIFCAAGTGTTAAGLLKGIHERGLKTILHVVPALKGGEFIADEIFKYLGHTHQLILHTDYHFGGYAKTKPELIDFIKSFVSSQGVLIDPVYTAKMMYAIDDLSKRNYFKKEEKIIAIHTGGLMGILGMKDKF